MTNTNVSNKKIAKNSLILYADLIINSVIWLYASRLLLEALGVANFGLYNVVGGIVVLLNILNTAMISTSYRYTAFEIGKKDGDVNKIFNICRTIHTFIAIAIILLALPIGYYYIHNFLKVEGASISDAIFVYNFSVITCALSTFMVPYIGLLTATENFVTKAIINISRGAIRLGLIIILLHASTDRLKLYAIFALIPELFVAISYIYYSQKKYYDIIYFKIVKEWKIYKEMFSFALWTLLGAGAGICRNQGASLLINFFYGTMLNAAYAISNTVRGFVGMAIGTLTQAATPQITKSYSSGDTERSVNIVIYISKYVYILLLLICVPIFFQTDYILNIWLTEVPPYTSIFVKLILLETLISALGAGVSSLYQATGKVRSFQLATSVILIASVIGGYVGYKIGLPPQSILIIYCIFSLIDRIVALVLLKIILKTDIRKIIRYSYFNSFKLTVFVCPLYFLNCIAATGIQQFLMMLATEVVLILIVYLIGLDKNERKKLNSVIRKLCQRNNQITQ